MEFYTVFIVILCFSWCSSIEKLFAQNDSKFDGLYGLTDSLEKTKTRSAIECHAKCVFNKDCLSIFYNSKMKECVLHRDSYTYIAPPKNGDGWKFYLTKDGSHRCPSNNGFMLNRKLDLCFNLNTPMTINYPIIKTFCQNMGAELVRIDSAEKQQFIEFITANDNTERICIQGTNTYTPGIWTFDDGTLMTYFNWDKNNGQPEEDEGNVEMYTGYKWHDVTDVKSDPCLPICERTFSL
ncbi:unnamed protein product [Mytilus coruscus]|uniref:C-type lectin domain-containing protein n=1 Tax=Mytilus coruscus TaxID=42192 RepID=A0A6J8BPH1_MYTCO|nr:unnamed protein product [Mytilus coruscus]